MSPSVAPDQTSRAKATAVDWIVAVSVALIAVVVILRETGLISRVGKPVAAGALSARVLPPGDWESIWVASERTGEDSADTKVLVFADFECPFCRTFHKQTSLSLRHTDRSVAVGFLHFPLQGHRVAITAAVAVECAGKGGKFWEMHDVLFDLQDSLGLRSWTSMAIDAGVSDTIAFNQCLGDGSSEARIAKGRKLGEQTGVSGTPTVVINGTIFARPPTSAELDSILVRRD